MSTRFPFGIWLWSPTFKRELFLWESLNHWPTVCSGAHRTMNLLVEWWIEQTSPDLEGSGEPHPMARLICAHVPCVCVSLFLFLFSFSCQHTAVFKHTHKELLKTTTSLSSSLTKGSINPQTVLWPALRLFRSHIFSTQKFFPWQKIHKVLIKKTSAGWSRCRVERRTPPGLPSRSGLYLHFSFNVNASLCSIPALEAAFPTHLPWTECRTSIFVVIHTSFITWIT